MREVRDDRACSTVLARLDGSAILRPVLRMPLLGRTWLRTEVLGDELARAADVTVVIGVRNRADHRLVNTLRSLCA